MGDIKRKKYIFELDGFDYKKIIDEYFYNKISDTPSNIYFNEKQTTDIVNNNICEKVNTYIQHVTMAEFKINGILPPITDKHCWWCRHRFDNSPIGLPINYYCNSNSLYGDKIKNYFEKKNIMIETDDFFEVEGIFCSFPCCKAYILDQPFNDNYKNSISLLYLLYYKLYEMYPDNNFYVAPSWKLLENYGGHLSIDEFRESIGNKDFNLTINIKRPYMFITGIYSEENKVKDVVHSRA